MGWISAKKNVGRSGGENKNDTKIYTDERRGENADSYLASLGSLSQHSDLLSNDF